MPRMTLLEMTQNILSAMSSDEVNSISDTVESVQVAEEIRNTYYELYSNRELSRFEGLVNLESLNNVNTPNVLQFPDNVHQIKWIKYRNFRNSTTSFDNLTYLDPEDFIYRVVEQGTSQTAPYVVVQLLNGNTLYPIRSDKAPQYYTVLDRDRIIVFDSFDQMSEAYLTGSSSMAWATLESDFSLEDDFIPDLETSLFPHLLSEAKAACFINLKEISNSKEEQRSRRQLVRSQNKTGKLKDEERGPFYWNDYSRNR